MLFLYVAIYGNKTKSEIITIIQEIVQLIYKEKKRWIRFKDSKVEWKLKDIIRAKYDNSHNNSKSSPFKKAI